MPPGAPPRAQLSVWHAGALVVASMIGTGVFTTSGLLMASLGSRTAVLLVWAAGGLLALMGAAVYAELGAMLPEVGGEYVYLSHAFAPIVGFLSGWIALLVGFAAPIAAGAAAFGQYAHAALPGLSGRGAGLALIAVVTALHAREVVWAGRLHLAVTVINLAALLALVVAGGYALLTRGTGLPAGAAAALTARPTAGGIAVALVLVSYSYAGWNSAAYVAGEVHTPQRSVPRALVIGCALVTALYVGINTVFVTAVAPAALAGQIDIADLTARALFGPATARGLSALVALIMAVSVSALAMTGPRIYLAMAENGHFFRLFAARNRAGAPSAGAILQGLLALALYLTAAFDALLVYVGFTLSLSAAATVAAAWWLRRREPDRPRPYRTPGWPLTPFAFCAASLWMAVYSIIERPRATLAGAGTIAVGAVLYAGWRRGGRAPGPS